MSELRIPNFRNSNERINYLDEVKDSDFGRAYKQEALRLLDTRAGQTVLDLGCGNGDDARELAAQSGCHVVGIDSDPAVIQEARRRMGPDGGLLEFREGDAHSLPFGDDAFDRARADRVFQMLPDRMGALRELVRVTKPGGFVVVSNPGGGAAIDIGDRETSRRIFSTSPATGRDDWSGVELPNLFKDLGLQEIEIRPYVHCWTDFTASEKVTPMRLLVRGAIRAGVVAEPEARRWLEQLVVAGRGDRFTFVHVIMSVRGTVPVP